MAGIRQLALVAGMAMILAGCEAGLTAGGADDPAAAALATEEITATSLAAVSDGAEAGGVGLAVSDGAEAGGVGLAAAAATADPDAAAVKTAAPPAADAAAPETAAADGSPPEAADAAKPARRKGLFGFLAAKPGSDNDPAAAEAPDTAAEGVPAGAEVGPAKAAKRSSVRLVDRDVEAPDVFQVTEQGLWDGRPSLGGIWVAYSDVRDPERVIIRNTATGSFVIGALFRRERENPGPRLQVSSDAASALGMLAGAPAKLNVTALRREEVADEADAEALLSDADTAGGTVSATDAAVADAPAAAAAATPTAKPVSKAAARAAAKAAAKAAAEAPVPELSAAAPQSPAPVVQASAAAPGKPFVQIGIFGVEGNANGTAATLRKVGLTVTVKKESSQGKTYWRVLAGPAATTAERDAIVAKVKGLGFPDAYFVSK